MNFTPKALVNFTSFSDPKLETKAFTIINAITGNANFPNPTPPITDVETAAKIFSAALAAVKTGTRADIAVKNEKRDALVALLRKLAASVNSTADGNRAMLNSCGFDTSKSGNTPPVITKPQNMQVWNGENPGELTTSVSGMPGGRAYVHEYTSDATLSETSWQRFTVTQTRYTFYGLEPGKKYYCRVAVVGSKGQMIYSDIVSRIVL